MENIESISFSIKSPLVCLTSRGRRRFVDAVPESLLKGIEAEHFWKHNCEAVFGGAWGGLRGLLLGRRANARIRTATSGDRLPLPHPARTAARPFRRWPASAASPPLSRMVEIGHGRRRDAVGPRCAVRCASAAPLIFGIAPSSDRTSTSRRAAIARRPRCLLEAGPSPAPDGDVCGGSASEHPGPAGGTSIPPVWPRARGGAMLSAPLIPAGIPPASVRDRAGDPPCVTADRVDNVYGVIGRFLEVR
jgi:hypothetical protein